MKHFTYLILAILMCGCQRGAVPAPGVNAGELCEQTVRDYAVLRDEGPADAYADLFTAGGTFTLGPTVTQGRENLIARHKSANLSAIWRHNIVDVRISEKGESLTGVSRFIIYTGPHPAPASNPREIIGDYIDIYTIENGRCLISSRQVRILFDS